MKKSVKKFIWSKRVMAGIVVAGALMTTGVIFGLNGYFGGGEKGVPEDTMTRGLVLAYNFDEGSGQTAYNAAATGSVNDGTLGSSTGSDANDPVWINRGRTAGSSSGPTPVGFGGGGALNFDGTDDYVDCGSDDSLDFGSATDFTIEAWVKPNIVSDNNVIVAKKGWGSGVGKGPVFTPSKVNVGDGTDRVDVNFGGVTTDEWSFLSATFDRDGSCITYVNGVATGNSALMSAIDDISNSLPLRIGVDSDAGNVYPFNGTIDGVKIYNRALSAEEVRYHYNRGGPVAHWKFDEGTGSAAYDSTDNNNDGTLYGEMATSTSDTSGWTTGNPSASSGSSLRFDGTDDYVDCGSIGNGKTMSFWLNPDSIDESVFEEVDDTGVTIVSGTMTYPSWDNCYVNGIDTNTITTGWHHIVLTSTSNVTITAFRLGLVNATYFDGMIDDVKIYDYARSVGEIRLDYNAGFAVRFGGTPPLHGVAGQCSTDPASCISHGLVASYDFNEGDGQTLYNAADTGSVNDGTLGSSASADSADPSWISDTSSTLRVSDIYTSGSGGGALDFDGTDDYVDCGNDSSLDITDAITIEAWVKPVSITDARTIAGKYTGSEGYVLQIRDIVETGRLTFVANSTVSESDSVIQANVWSHVVVTYESDITTSKFYINGIPDGTDLSAGTITNNSEDGSIGSLRPSNLLHYLNGSIDGVKIYNRALSAEEVRYHYNRGGPVAHWKFDEGSGQYARDAIGDADAQLGSGVGSSGDTHDPVWSK